MSTVILTSALVGAKAKARVEARPLAATASVYFKVTRRIDMRLLSWWQRWMYENFCRKLPAKWKVPPVVPMERGGFMDFADADAYCTSPDDQLHVLPFNWAYSGEQVDKEIVCRPRDNTDRRNTEVYALLRDKFEAREFGDTDCDRLLASLPAIDSRLRALEARVHALEQEGARDARKVT